MAQELTTLESGAVHRRNLAPPHIFLHSQQGLKLAPARHGLSIPSDPFRPEKFSECAGNRKFWLQPEEEEGRPGSAGIGLKQPRHSAAKQKLVDETLHQSNTHRQRCMDDFKCQGELQRQGDTEPWPLKMVRDASMVRLWDHGNRA